MSRSVPHKVGVALGLIQFFFTLTWTVYVIFLPQLAAQVGIAKEAVLTILMLDQAIFMVADTAMGIWADKAARAFGRLSRYVVMITLASCLAFLLLPLVTGLGAGAQWLFLALTVTWSVTSSALRAPPLVLLGKYSAQPSIPWLASLSLFGLGIAGALSPYLTAALRGLDPRWPFALSSIALALATLGMLWVERTLVTRSATEMSPKAAAAAGPPVPFFLAAIVVLGLGFQIHFSLNSAAQYLRFAKPADLEYLMPVFWIGFNLLMLPASMLTSRYGAMLVMGVAGWTGALAAYLASIATGLDWLIAAQFVAGGAWGIVMMSAFAAALTMGRTGREGLVTGAMFSLLALAAIARIAIVATQLNKDPLVAPLLSWAPAVAWIAGGAVLLWIVWSRHNQRQGSAA